MYQKVIRSGHSLAVTVPKRFVEAMGIRKGDRVQVQKRPDKGLLLLHFAGAQQLILSGLVREPSRKTVKPLKLKK